MKLNTLLRVLVVIVLLLITAHRLPAPISEIETPTPAPERSAKPKPKSKPKVTNEKSEGSMRLKTPSQQKTEPTPNRNSFDGTWVGTLNGLPFSGDTAYTLVVSAAGTAVNEKSRQWGSLTNRAACDGATMRWTNQGGSRWTVTPNSDAKTAIVTCYGAGLFGVGGFNVTAVFHKTSP